MAVHFEVVPSNNTPPGQSDTPAIQVTRKMKLNTTNPTGFLTPTGVTPEDTKNLPSEEVAAAPEAEAEESAEPAERKPAPRRGITEQDRRVYKKSVELRKLQAKLEQERAEIAQFREAGALLKTNPVEALKRAGSSWEEIAKWVIDHPNASTGQVDVKVLELEQKYQALQNQLAERDRQAQATQEQLDIQSAKATIHDQIIENREKYKYMAVAGKDAVNLAWQALWSEFKVTGQTPTQEDVAIAFDAVEQGYRDYAKKLSAVERPERDAAAPPPARGFSSREERPVRTLSNAISSRPPARSNEPETEEEHMAKVVRVMKQHLKSNP